MPSPSLQLRVGGAFAILVAGSAGVLLPLALATARDASAAPWLLRLKAFGAGVVLSLAVVHLIKEALEAFSELTPGARARKHTARALSRLLSVLPSPLGLRRVAHAGMQRRCARAPCVCACARGAAPARRCCARAARARAARCGARRGSGHGGATAVTTPASW
jgi:hypothetical protein